MCETMVSLVTAIKNKYDDSGQDGGDGNQSWVIYAPKHGPKTQSGDKLRLPPRLTMDNQSICEAGDGQKIAELCGTVKELDMTKNMITDWREIFKILQNIPHLEFLNLTKNSLADDTFIDVSGTYPKVRDLVLNGTGASWTTVGKLLEHFPSLTELHLSLNKYGSVDIPSGTSHPSLTKLFLNDCDINDWADIARLATIFPNLESLNLINTNIQVLSDAPLYSEFPALKSLNVSDTNIQSWEEIEKMRRFPALTDLRISGLSFIEEWDQKLRRQHLIAHLPNITKLNGSPVFETEREDAERCLIRHFMDKKQKTQRYEELIAKYGELDPLAQVDLSNKETMNLLVKFENQSKIMTVAIYENFRKFKYHLEKFTGISSDMFQIFHLEMIGENCANEISLNLPKYDTRTLFALGISDQDVIRCDRDVPVGNSTLEEKDRFNMHVNQLMKQLFIEKAGLFDHDGKLLAKFEGMLVSQAEILRLLDIVEGRNKMTENGIVFCGLKFSDYHHDQHGVSMFMSTENLMCLVYEVRAAVIVVMINKRMLVHAREYLIAYGKYMNGIGEVPKTFCPPSLTEAIEKKYAVQDEGPKDSISGSNIKIVVPKKGFFYGSDGKLNLPARLTMEHQSINSAGDEQKLAELCRQLKELDLTGNNVEDWKEVFKMLKHIPELHFLNLCVNKLMDKTLSEELCCQTFPGLKELVLNYTFVSWETVDKLLKCFPSLTELHLGMNRYESIELSPETSHGFLKKFILSHTCIKACSELSKIAKAFPNLELLNLGSEIETLPDKAVYTEFPALKILVMSASKLASWEEIEKFRRFPVLTRLKIGTLPFFAKIDKKTVRQRTIAYLPNITMLNGSPVMVTEREDAERSFIRHYMDSENKPQRYEELVAKYGNLDPLVEVDLTPKDTLNLLVKYDEKSEIMEINVHQTITELKKFLRNFTGLRPAECRLYHVEKCDGVQRDTHELKHPNRKVLALNMSDGDEIFIHKKIMFTHK